MPRYICWRWGEAESEDQYLFQEQISLMRIIQKKAPNNEGVENLSYRTLHNPRQGGYKPTLFVFVLMLLDNIGFVANMSHYAKLQPEACGEYSCVKGTKALLFYASIYLLALGGGGIRGSVPSLGADQFDENIPKEIVVWVSTNKGWDKSFIISIACTFTGLVFVALGKPFYRIRVPGESAFLNVLQVLLVAGKNRKLQLPQNSGELYELHSTPEQASCGERIRYSQQFRFLDKAAVLPEGTKPEKWKVCTITQVEEVKILTRMIPILLSTTLMNTCLAQLQTFSIQQGTLMDTKVGTFDVPAASIPIIPLLFMCILVPVYEVFFVPLFRKLTGHPSGISHLQRVGVGLVLSVISMGIAGLVEVKRRNEFVNHNKRINLFWLSYQYGIFGIADMFTFVGLMEFFYSEAPKGMKSLSTSFSWLSLSIGFYLSTIFVEIINSVTSRYTSSKKGWLEGLDMNKNHVELFYWFLAILSVLNLGNYVYWANWYKYKINVPVEPIEQPMLTGTPSNNPSPSGWSPVIFATEQGKGTN
ncbi:hypothetical protein AgCh_029405 [Apium graveolens]